MPPIRKRGPDTACAVPGMVDTFTLKDEHAERMVLAGLLREPKDTLFHLRGLKFEKGDLYFDPHQRLYDICLWCHNGGDPEDALLVAVFEEVWKRATKGWWMETFEGHNDFAEWLVDIWDTDLWMVDMMKWGNVSDAFWPVPFVPWAATAAAYKVKHLATRRYAIHAANELMRDALSPIHGVEGLNQRIDEEW